MHANVNGSKYIIKIALSIWIPHFFVVVYCCGWIYSLWIHISNSTLFKAVYFKFHCVFHIERELHRHIQFLFIVEVLSEHRRKMKTNLINLHFFCFCCRCDMECCASHGVAMAYTRTRKTHGATFTDLLDVVDMKSENSPNKNSFKLRRRIKYLFVNIYRILFSFLQ